MDAWIKHLDHPLVLVGFMAFLFAGLVKGLVSQKIIKFNQTQSAQLMNKVLNFAFLLAVLGMVVGVFSQKSVLPNTPPSPAVSGNSISGTTISGSVINQAGGDVNQGISAPSSAVASPKNNSISDATISNSQLNQAGGNINRSKSTKE